jgi:hypothetical protein
MSAEEVDVFRTRGGSFGTRTGPAPRAEPLKPPRGRAIPSHEVLLRSAGRSAIGAVWALAAAVPRGPSGRHCPDRRHPEGRSPTARHREANHAEAGGLLPQASGTTPPTSFPRCRRSRDLRRPIRAATDCQQDLAVRRGRPSRRVRVATKYRLGAPSRRPTVRQRLVIPSQPRRARRGGSPPRQ